MHPLSKDSGILLSCSPSPCSSSSRSQPPPSLRICPPDEGYHSYIESRCRFPESPNQDTKQSSTDETPIRSVSTIINATTSTPISTSEGTQCSSGSGEPSPGDETEFSDSDDNDDFYSGNMFPTAATLIKRRLVD